MSIHGDPTVGSLNDEVKLIHRVIRVSGRVQGIGFRRGALNKMKGLGLAGTAQNQPTGGVEMHVEGSRNSIELFSTWAQSGPRGAKVNGIELFDTSVVGLVDTKIIP